MTQSKHFFRRERDGSSRLRIRLRPEEVELIEEAAGERPVLSWVHDAIREKAERDLAHRKKSKENLFGARERYSQALEE